MTRRIARSPRWSSRNADTSCALQPPLQRRRPGAPLGAPTPSIVPQDIAPRAVKQKTGYASKRGYLAALACYTYTTTQDSTSWVVVRQRGDVNRAAEVGASRCLVDEVYRDVVRDDPLLDGALEEETDALLATLAHIERPVVDVHANKGVGGLGREATRELHRVL